VVLLVEREEFRVLKIGMEFDLKHLLDYEVVSLSACITSPG
jgi:hypothetical protein